MTAKIARTGNLVRGCLPPTWTSWSVMAGVQSYRKDSEMLWKRVKILMQRY